MIYSDRQYNLSAGEIAKLKSALAATEAQPADDEWAQELEIEGLKSQIAELEVDIAHYDMLRGGEITFAKSFSLDALPGILIEARIASGKSQTDLAEEIGMQARQIQRYETTNYMGASLARLIEISKALNVHTAGLFETGMKQDGAVYAWKDIDDVVWRQMPVREMAKRKWFDVPHGADLIERAKTYFLDVAGPQFASALHRKKMRGSTPPNEYALLAWQARVLERAKVRSENEDIPPFRFDDRWLTDLARLTCRQDGPKRARQLLAEHGIVLVTEEHLPGTYLDGAAMLSGSDRPVIGLTLRHDRLDNFWFVLFHELGHIFLHLFDGLRYDFFDDETSSPGDKVEMEADSFALNRLIPDDHWDKCLSRFAMSEEAVQIDAQALNIDASIIAGRIRKERSDYTILTDIVGHRKVRAQLQEVSYDLE